MTFKIGDFPSSNAATTALTGAGSVNRAAENAVLRAKLYKDKMKDIYDTYPMTDPNVSSGGFLGDLGSFGKGLIGSGIFDKKEPSIGTQLGNMIGSYGDTSGSSSEKSSNWWDGLLGGWG